MSRHADEVREAQRRLPWKVFAEELGARLDSELCAPYWQHLQVRDDRLIGCASGGMQAGWHNARGTGHVMREKHLRPEGWPVFPRRPQPLDELNATPSPSVPPRVKGHPHLGASPAWNSNFITVDPFIRMPMSRLNRSTRGISLNNR